MAGEDDPVTPVAFSDEIAANLPAASLTYERFPGARHMLAADAPERMFGAIRRFLQSLPEPDQAAA